MTSTAKAEAKGKNRFSTGTLSFRDIENHADYKGSSIGLTGSVAANFDTPLGKYGQAQSTKQVKEGNNKGQLATGADSLQSGMLVGYGSDKDSQHSQTRAGINTEYGTKAASGVKSGKLNAASSEEITNRKMPNHSEKDYASDVSNLGRNNPNYKHDLNERISGLRKHYVDRKIERGVVSEDVINTLHNPKVVLQQSNGGYLYLSDKAVVIMNKNGQLVTTYGKNKFDQNIQSILKKVQ